MWQVVHGVATGCGVLLLVFAAWGDVVRRIIPNAVVGGIAVAGLLGRVGAGPAAVLTSCGVALALFIALAVLHRLRVLGGGDVKLAAAVAIGLPAASLGGFLAVTALAGGVLSAVHLSLRPLARGVRARPGAPLLRRVWAAECWRIRRHGSLPYGVAIACGGCWLLLNGG